MNRARSRLIRSTVTFILTLFVAMLCSVPIFAGERYRFSFSFSGQAQGTILIFFRFRVFYEAAAEIEMTAEADGQGGLRFQLDKISAPAYILRTLGFSGKALVMMTAFTDFELGDRFTKERVSRWQGEEPGFSRYIRKIKRLPFMVEHIEPQAFEFTRSASGVVLDASSRLRLHYKHHPQEIGIYFRVYALMAEMLGLYNHSVWPQDAPLPPVDLPSTWHSEPVDLTPVLIRIGEQTEKIVASAVKFEQEKPFELIYRSFVGAGDSLELVGENRSHPRIWKQFRLRRFERRLRVGKEDLLPIRDELEMDIENEKGQAGRGYLLLERIDSCP